MYNYIKRLKAGLWAINAAPKLFLWKDTQDTIHRPRWYVVSFNGVAPQRNPKREHIDMHMGPYCSFYEAFARLSSLVRMAGGADA